MIFFSIPFSDVSTFVAEKNVYGSINDEKLPLSIF